MRVFFIFPNMNTVEGFNHGVSDLSGGLQANGHQTTLLNINEHLAPIPSDEEILELVREYDDNRDRYPTFGSYYENLLSAFRPIAGGQ